MKKLIPISIVLALVAIWISNFPNAHAQGICLITSLDELPMEVNQAVYRTLDNATSLPVVDCFAITNISNPTQNTYLVSMAGIVGSLDNWNVQDNAIWFSTIALQRHISGELRGTLKGTPEFDEMIQGFNLDQAAKDAIIGGGETESGEDFPELQYTGKAYFPFANGKIVQYGELGVHDHGTTGWKAVDFLSWNADGLAPNAVYASVSGVITNICRDDTQLGMRVGPFYYLHLVDDPSFAEGMYISQHEYLGHMVVGTFNDECGHASQQPASWHLHFAFAPVNHELRLESWVLNTQTDDWTYGTVVRHPRQMIGPADWDGVIPPPPPEDPQPTSTPGGPPEPTATPGGPPRPPRPGDGNNGTNFWTFLTGGTKSIAQRFAAIFPEHQSINLALSLSEYAALPIKIVYVTSVMNFKWAFILMGLIIMLEGFRAIYGVYMLVKKALPVLG